MQPEFWIDANLPPSLASLITRNFGYEAFSMQYLHLLSLSDKKIFDQARDKKNVIILTKDQDFANLISRLGPPPKVLWITIGNCNNERLKQIVLTNLPEILTLLDDTPLVELTN